MSTISERPGVYTTYEVVNVRYSGKNGGYAGIAAKAKSGEFGKVYTVTDVFKAESIFGGDANITALIKLLLLNGAGAVVAVPVSESADNEAYKTAFSDLVGNENVKVLLCDSVDESVHALLKTAITETEGRNIHKLAIMESGKEEVQEIIAEAASLNCERTVLTAPRGTDENGVILTEGSTAAALAGVILSQADPAVPVNGAKLYGIYGTKKSFTEGETELLLKGGVTALEYAGGTVNVIRGVTTKTTTDGIADKTWHDINTVLVVDDVIPTVRNVLKNSFTRAKNTAQTRDAIKTRVIIELDKKKTAEIIENYGNVTAVQNPDDPGVCDVSFDFTVSHGLNQICVKAYITI